MSKEERLLEAFKKLDSRDQDLILLQTESLLNEFYATIIDSKQEQKKIRYPESMIKGIVRR